MQLLADTTTAPLLKAAINALARPESLLLLATLLVGISLAGYRRWTSPALAIPLGLAFLAAFVLSLFDRNFLASITKPDNTAIVGMLALLAFFFWLALRRAALNDRLIQQNLPLTEPSHTSRTYVWPDLVYIELICLLLVSVALIIWSILVKAPLEQPANPGFAPNPAKAPWYFLGLQELLVYFDPWVAGVLYPALIILGLCALPFIDPNPKGNGYYTLRHRRLAIPIWLFGFLVLWIVPILIGTFLRGPNWSFFGPFEPWDINRHDTAPNIDLSQLWWEKLLHRPRPTPSDNPLPWAKYWLVRECAGLFLLATYLLAVPLLLRRTLLRRLYPKMGRARYVLAAFLFLMMLLLPIKMLLHWAIGLKYFIYLPEWNASL